MNLELFKKVRQAVADDPQASMAHWLHPCGTGCCIAGKAAILSDHYPIRHPDFGYLSQVSGPDGTRWFIEECARNALGLTSTKLFWPTRWPENRHREGITDQDHPMWSRDTMLKALDEIIEGRRDPNTMEMLPEPAAATESLDVETTELVPVLV